MQKAVVLAGVTRPTLPSGDPWDSDGTWAAVLQGETATCQDVDKESLISR